jgi:hypothetical protein
MLHLLKCKALLQDLGTGELLELVLVDQALEPLRLQQLATLHVASKAMHKNETMILGWHQHSE